MSNVSIAWDQTAPADGDGAGAGAGAIRSFKTAMQLGLNAEHDWPTSTGNAGGHKLGSARVFVGPSSQISSTDTTGRMMWETTNESLVYLSSASTAWVGGRQGVGIAGGVPLAAAGQRIGMSFMSVSGSSWPSGQLTFPVPFISTPWVSLQIVNTGAGSGDFTNSKLCLANSLVSTGLNVWVINSDKASYSTLYATVQIMAVGPVAY